MKNSLETILAYHQRTKHFFQRYAAGPEGLDWKSQPDPFRTFDGCTELQLPLLEQQTEILYNDLYQPDKISLETSPFPLSINGIAQLLELSFGLSAWKQYEDTRWALRCNPSSGNLHPTESYIIIENCDGISDGVHHYVSRDHLLEQRCQFNHKGALLPADSFLVGLSSIHWREAWKYGERAFRYCQHDVGHAIAAVRYAAATMGWQATVLTNASDNEITAILGIDRKPDFVDAESEHPDVILLITTRAETPADLRLALMKIAEAAKDAQWNGRANTLSAYHYDDWPVIEEAALACSKPETNEPLWLTPALPAPDHGSATYGKSASAIIKQRRSAQDFDGSSSITDKLLYRMLDLTLQRQAIPPWDVIPWKPGIHLLLFIHRIEGLEPGLYLFLRSDDIKQKFKTSLKQEYEWLKPDSCPQHLQLYRLVAGDARNASKTLSCHQNIASDGALSIAMLAEYETNLTQHPWIYRQLFWEAGILGQLLYLEAESAGFRATGIGCYFDDEVHELLGITDHSFQSLYHFTMGTALIDNRLQTLPPYVHLQHDEREQT